jgi:hypothetical protein
MAFAPVDVPPENESYSPIPFASFGGGLNLRDKVDAVSEADAIDLLNVEFSDRGAVQQRHGFDDLTTTALTNTADSLHPYYTTGGTVHLLAGCGTRLEAINTSGAVVDSETALTSGTWDFTMFGTPASELAYAGQGNTTLKEWDGATWDNVANTPAAGALAVMSPSNRMVAGRFNTTTGGPTGGAGTSSPSHVYFSDAGSATAWTATNFIQVTPGDGEKVQSVVAWRDFVFIFKESKFFVVYGESTDEAGEPVFDYRTVDAGVGCIGPKAAVAGTDGVYFVDRKGVYRTTGDESQRLSDAIEPIFLGGSSDYFMGGELLHSQASNTVIGYHDERVYVAYTSTGTANNYVLEYDPAFGWWSLHDYDATSFASFRISSQAELVWGDSSGSKEIMRTNATLTNDNGAAITSRWRGGWFDMGSTEQKTIRESKVWGTGLPFMAVAPDFQTDPGTLTQLQLPTPIVPTWNVEAWNTSTWGGSAASLEPVLRRFAVRGTVFSTYFENAVLNEPWAVHRLSQNVREQRVPSVITS